MKKPVWIDERDALVLHNRLLELHGGAGGLRDGGLLQSALARPQQQYSYAEAADIIDMAAAYTAVSCATTLSSMATSVRAS
jgi:death-on-curing protein